MICDGSSTKSQATLVPARAAHFHAAQAVMQQVAELVEDGLRLRDASAAPAGLPAGGVRLPQIRPRCGWKPSFAGSPVMNASIQAPPRLFSRGYQSA